MEQLEKYNACPEGMDFMRTYYPDGAEALEILKNPNLPKDYMHFAVKYIHFSDEEIQEYEKLCNIINSTSYYFSEDIQNCYSIANSKHINNSKYIRNSENITDSENIYDSRDIKFSHEVLRSISINKSDYIMDSKEVTHSVQIYKSDIVNWSKNIYSSLLVNDCQFLYQSSHANDCYFGGFLNGCNHCLFCSDLTDKQYCIFNEEVTQREFERTKEQLQFMLESEHSKFIMTNGGHNQKNHFHINSVFNGLSPEFYGWIGTLKHFNEEIFYKVFLVV